MNPGMCFVWGALASASLFATNALATSVDLSEITKAYVAADGDTLSGKLSANVKISVADGATVTLDGVTILGTDASSRSYGGINCNGDCKLIISGENRVRGFYKNYPGIHVPEGSTLVIDGDGSLTALSNGFAAGIGGGFEVGCGNIQILGGKITATGGTSSAAIGSGYNATGGDILIAGDSITAIGGGGSAAIGSGNVSTCGNITISGGVVNATSGSDAMAIGSGNAGSSCGNILISGGFISAIGGGSYGSAGIGAGGAVLSESSCGNIDILISVARVMAVQNKSFEGTTVGGYKGSTYGTVTVAGVVQDSIKDSIYIFETYTIALHGNFGSDTVALQNMVIGAGVTKLMAPPFTREGFTFKNWTTEADGSGTAYSKNTALSNLSKTAGDTVHLYAQWTANSYTVTFDENHEEPGDGSMEDQGFTYDVAGNLNANEFIRFDYVFDNWNTAADGSGSAYADKASVKNLSATNKDTVVLYAQWLKPLSHSDIIVPFIDEQVYTGSAIIPEIVISDNESVLKENVDYKLAFANNVDPGKATVTITGLGKYTGEVVLNFTIVREETTFVRMPGHSLGTVRKGRLFDLKGRQLKAIRN